jgi:hypothetical protein
MDEQSKPGRGEDATAVVYHDPTRDRGAPVEPEEQAAEVVQPLPTFVTIGSSALARDVPMHKLPAHVQEAARGFLARQAHVAHQTTAGELAESMVVRCQGCRHFDHDGWLRVKREAEASGEPDRLLELNVIRGMMESSQNIHLRDMHDLAGNGSLDLEHALNSIGVCHALSEHHRDTIFVHPLSTCPADGPFLFQPKRELRKAGEDAYDWILRRAEGPER